MRHRSALIQWSFLEGAPVTNHLFYRRMTVFILFNLISAFSPGVDNMAHLGGLAAGLLSGFYQRKSAADSLPQGSQPYCFFRHVRQSKITPMTPPFSICKAILVSAPGMPMGTHSWAAQLFTP